MDDALARRWRAARGFGWIPGMMTTHYGRVLANGHVDRTVWGDTIPAPTDALPDLDDPLTRAAALLMARAAWDQPMLCAKPYGEGWAVTRPPTPGAPGLEGMLDKILGQGPTELEALIAALEAAPETKP